MWLLEKGTIERLRAMGPEARNVSAEAIELKIGLRDIRQDIGKTARINVKGILANEADWSMFFFGGTLYPEIIDAIQAADADENVDNIEIHYESPGGNFLGYVDTYDAIRAASKPVTSIVHGMAASAAYGLSTAGDRIVATNRASMVGSVGVAIDTLVFDGTIKEISIANTDSPKKRPDLLTDEGKDIVREELDAIADIFMGSIADGRSAAIGKQISVKNVSKTYGQGAVILAEDALNRGMIDALEEGTKQAATQKAAAAKLEDHMDLAKLKAEYPTIYAEAVAIGVAEEKDRAGAHLTYGERCNAMERAIEAVKSGEPLTETLRAEYLTSGRNAQDLANLADDNPDAGDANKGGDEDGLDMSDIVADMVCKQMGVEVN